ncbi:hypothetical protein EX30DRAFT_367074 [Ascodesmis nigricans]|uniref:Uncharacterized protein n=1 Tax=Ascodesmis nigricans TaxID=341454 RepID=A0A4S2MJ15_9PEZI|nr:hypothetical protein EX30DRAFT_367074 [Ascodesmis nigricans]
MFASTAVRVGVVLLLLSNAVVLSIPVQETGTNIQDGQSTRKVTFVEPAGALPAREKKPRPRNPSPPPTTASTRSTDSELSDSETSKTSSSPEDIFTMDLKSNFPGSGEPSSAQPHGSKRQRYKPSSDSVLSPSRDRRQLPGWRIPTTNENVLDDDPANWYLSSSSDDGSHSQSPPGHIKMERLVKAKYGSPKNNGQLAPKTTSGTGI